MSVTSIRACYNMDAALNYQESKGGIDRCAKRSGNLEPKQFRAANKALRRQYGRLRQGYTIIQSFSHDELDYTNADDIETAHLLGVELASRQFPNSLFQVVTHTDSKSHCVHNHISILNHDFESRKAIQNTSWFQLKRTNDALMKEYDMRVCAKSILSKDQREYWSEKRGKSAELWQNDLRSRIDKAILKATDIDEFQNNLAVEGVNAFFYKADGKELLKNFTFSFQDETGKIRKKRGEKMGTQYSKAAILKQLEKNAKQSSAAPKKLETMSEWIAKQPPKAAPEPCAALPSAPELLEAPEPSAPKVAKIRSDEKEQRQRDFEEAIKKEQNDDEERRRRTRIQIEMRLREIDEEMSDETLDEDSPQYRKLSAERNQLKQKLLKMDIEETQKRKASLQGSPELLREELLPKQFSKGYELEFG